MRNHAYLAAVLLAAALLHGCSSECGNSDSKCEGNVAVICLTQGSKGGYSSKSIDRKTCPANTACVSGAGFAGCTTSATACTAAESYKGLSCIAGLPSYCGALDGGPAVVYYPQLGAACLNGNACFNGLCVQSQATCTPATFAPACIGGVPVGCPSDSVNPSYPTATATCSDGNTCFANAELAGCSKDGTVCDFNAFHDHCEGGKLVSCNFVGLASKQGTSTTKGLVQVKTCNCVGDATSGSCSP